VRLPDGGGSFGLIGNISVPVLGAVVVWFVVGLLKK
jgi:hypothetical protein